MVKARIAGEGVPVVATPEHLFYVRVHRARDSLSAEGEDGGGDGEWMAAGELRAGDLVRRADGGWVEVVGVEREERVAAVYNIEVAEHHNYFVGTQGVLVHNSCDAATLLSNHYGKLQSILARRGSQWGFAGSVNDAQVRSFANMIADHVTNAAEVWRASYRGSDRLFHITGDQVVVTHLDGTFESAWKATAAQLNHYRSGVQIK